MRDLNIDDKILPIRSVMSEISAAKNELQAPEDYAALAGDMRKRHISSIYTEYMLRLAKYNAVDFDDIIMKTVALLEQNEDVAAWSDATVQKIRQVLTRMLVECGYLENARSELLLPVYLYPELEEELVEKDPAALAAFDFFI